MCPNIVSHQVVGSVNRITTTEPLGPNYHFWKGSHVEISSIAKLEKLQEKALKCIENECQKKVDVDLLYGKYGIQHLCLRYCTKPLSTIQCNKTLCRDQLVPILLIG